MRERERNWLNPRRDTEAVLGDGTALEAQERGNQACGKSWQQTPATPMQGSQATEWWTLNVGGCEKEGDQDSVQQHSRSCELLVALVNAHITDKMPHSCGSPRVLDSVACEPGKGASL